MAAAIRCPHSRAAAKGRAETISERGGRYEIPKKDQAGRDQWERKGLVGIRP